MYLPHQKKVKLGDSIFVALYHLLKLLDTDDCDGEYMPDDFRESIQEVVYGNGRTENDNEIIRLRVAPQSKKVHGGKQADT